jgi:hypothetical protein
VKSIAAAQATYNGASQGPGTLLRLAQRSIRRSLAVVAQAASAGNLSALNRSFRRTLRAEDKSERTAKSSTEAVRLFIDFLANRSHLAVAEGELDGGARSVV